jgi:two-component system response regulator YesN
MGGKLVYRVLLVDGNHHSIEKFKGIVDWKCCGFVLEDYAVSLDNTMNFFRKRCHNLVLINMTQLNNGGLRICEQIRKEDGIVPIILIGGAKDFQLFRKALNLQVRDYIPDPVQPNELLTTLLAVKQGLDNHKFIGQKKSKQPNRPTIVIQSPTNIIEKVKAYIEEALNENITLKEISENLHYNCSYLGQKFKYYENMTFNEYLLQQRMKKAKHLLENTDMKIYEIANEVGYIELDWFYKKFKEHTGVSANEYRKIAVVTA